MKKPLLAAVLLAALPFAAVAAPINDAAAAAADPVGWSGAGEFGLAVATGNTKAQNVNAKFDLKYNDDTWKDDFYLLALRNKSQDNLTANRYEAGASAGYKLDDRSYIVGALRYEHDAFSPYTYQYIASIGYGYQFLKNDTDSLSAEAGPGYKVSQPSGVQCLLPVDPKSPPGPCHKLDSDSNVVLRGKLDYKHVFNATTSFVDTFVVEAGSGNKFFQNDAGVLVKLSDKLALKVGYQIRHNSQTFFVGQKKTDTLFTTNIVYGF